MLVSMRSDIPGIEALDIEDRLVPGWEGDPDVGVRIYRPKDRAAPVPGILLIHGGGFIVGSVEAEHVGAAMMAINTGAVVVSVEYRLAPEHPVPGRTARLLSPRSPSWPQSAAELGVDPERLAVVGTSAGGGLAAATALMARDLGGPALCFQMLHIPELDDRLETPLHADLRRFTGVESAAGGPELAGLPGRRCTDDVSPYAAPARAENLAGLPPAYISTAENDPLRDEGILYGLRLLQAGVSVELHQFPGTFHGSALVTAADFQAGAAGERIVLRRALGVD